MIWKWTKVVGKYEGEWVSNDECWRIVSQGSTQYYLFHAPKSGDPLDERYDDVVDFPTITAAKRFVDHVRKCWFSHPVVKLDSKMLEAVDEFRVLHKKDYGTQKAAAGECYYASNEFLHFLFSKGIIKPGDDYETMDIEFAPLDDRFSALSHDHVVARVGNVCFDWTLRQYCYSAVFPYIFALWEKDCGKKEADDQK